MGGRVGGEDSDEVGTSLSQLVAGFVTCCRPDSMRCLSMGDRVRVVLDLELPLWWRLFGVAERKGSAVAEFLMTVATELGAGAHLTAWRRTGASAVR